MKRFFSNSWLRVLSGLFTNLAAGYFGLVIVIPSFTKLKTIEDVLLLISNVGAGILFLVLAVKLDENLKEE